jgi:predicted adenine nucleotide alpha hydrolase (AANH) superfamily ATPase
MNVLLHVCCANCAIYPVRLLREAGNLVTGYFFNHNIHPYQEYLRRLEAVEQYAAASELQPIAVPTATSLDSNKPQNMQQNPATMRSRPVFFIPVTRTTR